MLESTCLWPCGHALACGPNVVTFDQASLPNVDQASLPNVDQASLPNVGMDK